MKKYILNEKIRASRVRLIDEKKQQLGVVSIEDARQLADERDLDLLLVTAEADPPVCKLVDYGQFKYEQQKKDKLARKSGKSQVLKELKMSPKISDHDYMVRVNAATKFLNKGYKVKLTIFFKGREMAHPQLGTLLIKRFLEEISEIGVADSDVSKANRSMIVTIKARK